MMRPAARFIPKIKSIFDGTAVPLVLAHPAALRIGLMAAGGLIGTLAFLGGQIGLGQKEGFILYRFLGIPRRETAILGLALILIAFIPVPTSREVARFFRERIYVSFLRSAVVGVGIGLIYLSIGEAALRVASLNSLLDFPNYRRLQGAHTDLSGAIEYDATLGWRLKAGITSNWLNTIDLGVRRNAADETGIPTGGILAVGSSFTVGSEVNDDETWPAQLEHLLKQPVVNAGEGGYSVDQAILRAEELLPLTKPTTLIVDLIPDIILGAGYSRYGWPKPYFSVENGALVRHNFPVPTIQETNAREVNYKDVLGHIFVVNRFMTTFFYDYWYSSQSTDFTKANIDEVAVTCGLLARIKHKTDESGIRLLLTMQYPGSEVILPENGYAQQVESCARDAGIQIVDEFATLNELFHRDVSAFRSYYVTEPDGSTGHKSPLGNLQFAKMVAKALGEPPPGVQGSK